MVVVKVGGQRGRIMAQIEERNKKLRQKQELQYTREVYKKFDAVSSPGRPAGAVRWAPAPSPYPTALPAHGPDAAALGAPCFGCPRHRRCCLPLSTIADF